MKVLIKYFVLLATKHMSIKHNFSSIVLLMRLYTKSLLIDSYPKFFRTSSRTENSGHPKFGGWLLSVVLPFQKGRSNS